MEFSEKLRQARKRAGLSQTVLAKKAGITTRALQYYESGQRHPQSGEIVLELAKALNMTAAELSGDTVLPIPEAVRESFATSEREHMNQILTEISAVMAGEGLRDEDARAFMCAVNDIYFNSRKRGSGMHQVCRVEDYLD